MSPLGDPWTTLLDVQPQRSHQIAWFVDGRIEREHVLNVAACTDWWMRAVGLSAPQHMAHPQGIGDGVPRVVTMALVHDRDRAETGWHRSPGQVETLS